MKKLLVIFLVGAVLTTVADMFIEISFTEVSIVIMIAHKSMYMVWGIIMGSLAKKTWNA